MPLSNPIASVTPVAGGDQRGVGLAELALCLAVELWGEALRETLGQVVERRKGRDKDGRLFTTLETDLLDSVRFKLAEVGAMPVDLRLRRKPSTTVRVCIPR